MSKELQEPTTNNKSEFYKPAPGGYAYDMSFVKRILGRFHRKKNKKHIELPEINGKEY